MFNHLGRAAAIAGLCALITLASAAQGRRAPLQPPAGWTPTVPAGFTVSVFAQGLTHPRWLAVAPNGDVFVANTIPDGSVVVLHGTQKADAPTVFANHLDRPFGIVFHQNFVYVAEVNQVVRFKYDPKTSKRLGPAEHLLNLPNGGQDTTRSLAISADGQHLFVSVGDYSDHGQKAEPGFPFPGDPRRGAVTECDMNGGHAHIFASGMRNPVGLAVNPVTGKLWATDVNTDGLGNLPNDYFTELTAGAFFGWPYTYLGKHMDPRVKPERPALLAKALEPDVLLPAHSVPLQAAFYTGSQFPAAYRGGAFIAQHGPGNPEQGRGYQVVFIPFAGGGPSGAPQPFMTGFAAPAGGRASYGHPVGVAVAADGSLLVSDDYTNRIWRISYGK